ncbi:hypothetical protein GGI25_002953 [Coemansia spiralis]|uniref:P-type phospholipid transporter n=2 Tax=Coemansia TaxID=4863 RepID=A0A9W8G9J8_9FUNG|nr:hypothetical protein EDC05_002383 [Coemansia umbellata]KAJ2677708.1 hypothetical protein GGI25_002953 [Coemansia spiralis]
MSSESIQSTTITKQRRQPFKWLFKRAHVFFNEEPHDGSARKAAESLPSRKIYINAEVPDDELATHAQHYCTNAITTSQYTLINFLPKNLSRQFRRVANIYFLVLTILQLIGYFSVGSRFLTVVPILLVLAITALKDAFEDWRRHISDNHFNETQTRIVRNLRNWNLLWQDRQSETAKGSRLHRMRIRFARRMNRRTWYNQVPDHWEESQNPVDPSQPPVLDESAKWRNVRVGDMLILKTGDPAPSDMLILSTSADDGGCYVETKNLDGETNLKPRSSIAETAGVRDAEGCRRLRAVIEADPPSSNMTKLNGSLRIFSAPAIPEDSDYAFPTAPSTENGMASPVSPLQAVVSPISPMQATLYSSVAAANARQYAQPSAAAAAAAADNNNSYEMRLLSPKQSLPYRQSPLAKSTVRPGSIPEYHGDDEPTPQYDPKTLVAGDSSEIQLGKSLPQDVDHSANPLQVPFSISNVLLRGMTVRNTDWIVGVVLYTGEQTKIVLNSGPTPFKRSRIERTMNIQVMISFGFVFATSFIVALVGGLKYAEPEHRYSLYVDTTMGKGIYGFALFWSAMIMLQNIIPIALYVSIEFVKSWHAYWIYEDINMYYAPTDQRCAARNWNISDDLGQVSYVFSDKTGTLTRNVMDFRMCSINGTIYGKQLPGDELDVVKGRIAQEEVDRNNPPEGGTNPFFAEIQDEDDEYYSNDHYNRGGASAGMGAAALDSYGSANQLADDGRHSTSTSIASHGTSQYDSSPLISNADYSTRGRTSHIAAEQSAAIPAPAAVPIVSARSRTRTTQPMSEEEMQARRKQMIHAYLNAMRKVFDPHYVEIGNEDTGEGGSYTFVDPQLFYDMKPEVAPLNKIKSSANTPAGDHLDISSPAVRRIGSHRSISNGFDVDPLRQRDMVDLFLTELATCHSVVVEKNFQRHINNNDDDQSTIRRLTRIFHSRNSSRRITDIVRHRRHRSKHHGRTDSVATTSSAGDGVEWVQSETALAPMGHARNTSTISAAAVARSGENSAVGERFNVPSRYDSQPNMQSGDDTMRRHNRTVSSMTGPRDYNYEQEQAQSASQPASPQNAETQDMSKLAYSAESPDEGALVRAAKNFGYTFLGRIKNTLYLDIRGEKLQYEVLDTIEFDSTRKRMSSILRRPPPYNDIILFSKGADNVMIERLCKLPGSDESPGVFGTRDEVSFERVMRERTFNQIDEFANAGLRTLMLCYRKISESEWVRWSSRYHAALGSVDSDREEQITLITDEMERDLRIAGATAIEDKLQERVPDTIASLRAAGMKIWVLTGDKMETAINIGFAANLLTKEMELWTISSSSGADRILSRFKLIARIMREMAAKDIVDAVTSDAHATSGKLHQKQQGKVGLDPEEACVLGSISYKIGRAKKFLNIGHTLRMKRQRKHAQVERQEQGGTSYGADTTHVSSLEDGGNAVSPGLQTISGGQLSAFPGLQDDDMSPEEVRESIDYLQRHSSITDEGITTGDASDKNAAHHPLNALVIDGGSLSIVMEDPECRALLLEISPLFKSVICCRASPLQKAEVVKLIKDGLGLVTLAIGDGANDVSMIQTADIGVAISGEEGLQAAMASDYTFGRFHFLQNLLLVHGLYDYLRMSEMILSFFYKNVIWAMVPFWYSIYCAFSANVFYDLSYIQLYNVVFTVAPVVILGCLDKPFNYKTAMTYVVVYTDGIRNRYFQWWRYCLYVLDGVYQSVVIFFTFYLLTYKSDVQNPNGRTWGRSDLSTGPTVAVVIAASLCVGLNSWQWNWIMAAAIAFSIVVCIVYIAISSAVRYYSLEGVATSVMTTIEFWFGLVIAVVVALLPRYCIMSWQKLNRPRDLDIIREIKVLHRPWYGQVYVDPNEPIEFPDKDPKHHRPHTRKHKRQQAQLEQL